MRVIQVSFIMLMGWLLEAPKEGGNQPPEGREEGLEVEWGPMDDAVINHTYLMKPL